MMTVLPFAPGALRSCTALAGGLLLPMLMNAQVDRSKAPQPGPAPAVSMASHVSFKLSNGMRVIVVENRKLPLVSVQVRFDIPPVVQGDKAGYVDLMGELLAAGTSKRTKAELDEAVDQLGANFSTSNDGVFISGLRKHVGPMLQLAAEVTTSASFPEEEFQKAKVRTLSGIQQRKSDPDAIAETVGRAVLFGKGHPYGEVVTEATLANITADHLRSYYRHFFKPEHGYLVFVGDLTEKEARKWAKQCFGKWRVKGGGAERDEEGRTVVPGLGVLHQLEAPAVPVADRRVVLVDRPGAAQSVIRVGFPLDLQPRDVRALQAQVMNTILGGGVFNARLMQNLREDKAYTYGAYSTLEADRFNGSFSAGLSVRTEVTDSAVSEVLAELDRMRESAVSTEELELARSYMAGSFGRALEDPRTVARFALNTYLSRLEEDHYATYLQRLQAVNKQQVQEAAEAFLRPDKAVVFVVGDKQRIAKGLERFSMQTNMPIWQVDENGDRWREPPLERVRDRTAEQVMEAYVAALGGKQAIGRIRDLRIEMSAEVGGMTLAMTNWYGEGGQFRSETRVGSTVVQEVILDGRRAMSRGPQGVQELEDIDLEQVKRAAYPVPEVAPSRMAESMALVGRTQVNGREAYRLDIQTHAGTTITDHYDAVTGLRLRREELLNMGGRSVMITTEAADLEPVDGVLFPRTIMQSGGPMGTITMKVTSIAVNKGLLPGFFETGLPKQE